VQVFEHQHDRDLRCQRIEPVRYFAQHPLARCADGVLTQRTALVGRHQRRHLRQPGGGVLAKQIDEVGAMAGAAGARERIEHREIRFNQRRIARSTALAWRGCCRRR
jgi:hypothetical protein